MFKKISFVLLVTLLCVYSLHTMKSYEEKFGTFTMPVQDLKNNLEWLKKASRKAKTKQEKEFIQRKIQNMLDEATLILEQKENELRESAEKIRNLEMMLKDASEKTASPERRNFNENNDENHDIEVLEMY